MLIFGNNTPIKQKQWINTKVEFEWSEELQKYVEISSDGYWYDGDMALCTENFTGPVNITGNDTSINTLVPPGSENALQFSSDCPKL